MTKKVHVALGDRSYDILIGANILETAADHISAVSKGAKCAIVTDENVAHLHLEKLQQTLETANLCAGSIMVPAGEASKSFNQLTNVCEQLLSLNIERGDCVIAFGGGMVGDLAGFAASILRRGVRMIQVPTTLLAQVDSSVGGKTGINTPHGKNLIGTFHQPSLVLADIEILQTLSDREFRAGYAEVIKYGLLGDKAFYEWLEQNWTAIFDRDPNALIKAIETSCLAKATVVAEDEKEAGRRALLNLGHTFGHALEAWAGYSGKLLHGEAVALGMGLAFDLSEELDLAPKGCAARVRQHLEKVGLPAHIEQALPDDRPDVETLLKAMTQDKKVKDGKPAFILARDIGDTFVHSDVPMDKVANLLTQSL